MENTIKNSIINRFAHIFGLIKCWYVDVQVSDKTIALLQLNLLTFMAIIYSVKPQLIEIIHNCLECLLPFVHTEVIISYR